MWSRARLFLLALAALLAACQPVPQPFSHVETGDSVLLDLPDSGGIVVLELADAPPAAATGLANAMATALARRNVPAGTGSGNSRSHFLQGSIEDDGRDAAIVWTLQDPHGEIVETMRQSIEGTPIEPWANGDPALMERLAERAAPQIAALVQGRVPVENVLPGVRILPVAGAPGAGNRQLAYALRRHLAAFGHEIVEDAGQQDIVVRGTVAVSPPSNGRQQATLDWRVLDHEGKEVGKIMQSNPVAAGSLDGSWGEIADIAARGAAEGIDALIRRIDWRQRETGGAASENGRLPSQTGRR